MKKLLVPKKIESTILDEIKKISPDGDDFISVTLDYNSPYISKNINYLYELLEDTKNETINYKEQFLNDVLEIEEVIFKGEKVFDIHYTEKLDIYIRDYIFMVLPSDDNTYMQYELIPMRIFPLIFDSYNDLVNIIPDIVSKLIEKGLAYIADIEDEKGEKNNG